MVIIILGFNFIVLRQIFIPHIWVSAFDAWVAEWLWRSSVANSGQLPFLSPVLTFRDLNPQLTSHKLIDSNYQTTTQVILVPQKLCTKLHIYYSQMQFQ